MACRSLVLIDHLEVSGGPQRESVVPVEVVVVVHIRLARGFVVVSDGAFFVSKGLVVTSWARKCPPPAMIKMRECSELFEHGGSERLAVEEG